MAGMDEHRLSHGQLGYLQIPTQDVGRSVDFYSSVFAWKAEAPDSGFEAPGIIGQWDPERRVVDDGGVLLWINVDDIDVALSKVGPGGGEVVAAPSLDGGERWLATIRDCAGNRVGIFQLGDRRQA